MSSQGFIFNHNRCVACGACSAACILENGFSFRARSIYTYNAEAAVSLPVVNISMACNHCSKPSCLEGCPASALYRDQDSGAVLIDDEKCIGCRYCLWNCPYDAPVYLDDRKVSAKCTLCTSRLSEGLQPACSTACPTGALAFGTPGVNEKASALPWFPDRQLEPSLWLTGLEPKTLRVIPEGKLGTESQNTGERRESVAADLSLVLFSFCTAVSVSLAAAPLISSQTDLPLVKLGALVLAAVSALFHPGTKTRAWRALSNIRHSALSREIALFAVFGILSLLSFLLSSPALLAVSALAGLMLLLAIDAVYLYSDNRTRIVFHDGSALLSGLALSSFLSGMLLPFLFIAVLKLWSSFVLFRSRDAREGWFAMAFLRMALLVITCIAALSGTAYPGLPLACIYLAGELMARIFYYYDFEPLNIRSVTTKIS